MMMPRPQILGYGLSDSPAGLAAWMYDKFAGPPLGFFRSNVPLIAQARHDNRITNSIYSKIADFAHG